MFLPRRRDKKSDNENEILRDPTDPSKIFMGSLCPQEIQLELYGQLGREGSLQIFPGPLRLLRQNSLKKRETGYT